MTSPLTEEAPTLTGIPPVIPPDENPETGEGKPKKRKTLIISIITAVVVIALVVAGFFIYKNRQEQAHAQALTDCQTQVKKAATASTTFDTALTDTDQTAKITVEQVADPQTVTVLKDARDAQTPKALTCDQGASTEELTKTTETLSKNVSTLKTQATMVTEAAEKVTASKEKKDLDTATTTLTNTISAAQGTYDTTSSKVADEKTRENLKSVLDAANTEVKNEKRTIKSLSDQKKTLDDAVKAVNDSVTAKTEADAKAAAAAAAQAQRNTNTYRNNTNTYRNTSGGGTSTGGGSTGGSPAPAAPQKNGNGWVNGHYDWHQVTENPNCVEGHTGFCPIG